MQVQLNEDLLKYESIRSIEEEIIQGEQMNSVYKHITLSTPSQWRGT